MCDTQLNLSDLYEGEGPQNRDISLRAVDVGEKPDLLQAKVVPVSEVCANIDEWRDAIGDEVHSVITKHQAGSFRSEDAVREMEADPALEVIRVPGKLVAALKPPRRHKARLVACGNFLVREKCGRSSTLDRRDLYSAGLDVYSLRVQLCTGAHRLWKAASIDVRTAFLTAPYQPGRSKSEGKKKVVMVKVPRAVVLSGHAAPNTWIQVDKALYGLQESPHSWSLDRDQKMRCISWKGEDGNLRRLVQCMSDVSIWKIVDETGSLQGTIGVYVDDMLVMAADRELELAIQAIRKVWECSPTTYANSDEGLTSCGVQIKQEGKVTWLFQEQYVSELASRYPHLRPSPFLPDFKVEPEDEIPTAEKVREAQKVIGELTWISGRTRPDIAYAVSRISRYTMHSPEYACKSGEQVISYLLKTALRG